MRIDKFCLLSVAALLVPACLPSLALARERGAQISQETFGDLRVVSFGTLRGTVKVRVPKDIRRGDVLMGTVTEEPKGETEEEQDQNLGVLKGFVVEMEEQPKKIREGRMRWMIPLGIGVRYTFLVLRDPDGEEIATCTVPVNIFSPPTETPTNPSADDFELPEIGQAGGVTRLTGPISNGFEEGEIEVAGQSVEILAASPRSVMFESPLDVTGPVDVEVRHADIRFTRPYRNVAVQLAATQTNLIRNQRATLTVTVSGLQQLREPVTLTVENDSTAVVNLEGSARQEVQIPPQSVAADGRFILSRQLRGIRSGGFQIRAAVVTVPPPAPVVSLEATAANVLDFWERSARVRITPQARQRITDGVLGQSSELLRAVRRQRSSGPTLATSVVDSYLCALRDRKLRNLNLAGGGRPTGPFPFANAFSPQVAGNPPTIEEKDVSDYSFRRFWRRIRSIFTRAVSYLEVDSTPVGGEIHVNRDRVGLTRNSFVLTPGVYRIRVRSRKDGWSCDANRELQPEETTLFVCRSGEIVSP